ncbi:hypothetical protein JGI23_00457 [Candidatus Chrysopegis kryptomonas]|jgi:hypothetical protein|uniref:Uncharacterized protein n=2 Tax=Candidatus Chryseopegocella kryptomonas TaxID=1633643 RepID=A0A0P1MRN8_9BACT|nr:hypothetical protein JGI23_00457 [Candidatus Chrysopegis kryptomonas]
MRAIKFFAVLGLLLIFSISTAIPQGKMDSKTTSAKKVTLKGEVLDLACYVAGEKKGAEHKRCAVMCIKGGEPIGILTDDGKVYLVVEDHAKPEPYEKLKEFAAERVTITGAFYQRGGLPGVVIESVEPVK